MKECGSSTIRRSSNSRKSINSSRRRSGSSICKKRACDSIPAAAGRSFPLTDSALPIITSGADALQKASSEQHNYLKDGFYAKTNAEEIKCADLELNVLMSIEDVTAQVNAAVKTGMSPDAAGKARENAIAQIEKESKDKTGLRSDVVTLYQGGVYHLYRYKRYDDVRIVFAPEQQMAFYGGDPDNFEYPRFDLDICIFRAYENGQPAKIEHYLKWNSNGPSDGELTFVSGSPGRTDRQLTVDELADRRDREVPTWLQMFNRREVLLIAWGQRSFENARRARDDLFGDQNNRKRYDGYVARSARSGDLARD